MAGITPEKYAAVRNAVLSAAGETHITPERKQLWHDMQAVDLSLPVGTEMSPEFLQVAERYGVDLDTLP